MKCRIYFADEQVREAFMVLRASRDSRDLRLAERLDQALDRIAADAFCGIQVPKKLIPKDYHTKYGPLDNLWKYKLAHYPFPGTTI
jgi:hypothetical protein